MMQIQRQDFDDHGEPDATGLYEWRYVGTDWSFTEQGTELRFRRYSDEPRVATLISPSGWRPEVFASSLFEAARDWLRDHEVIEVVQVHHPPTGSYRPLAESLAAARALGLPTASLQVTKRGTA